MKIDTVFIAIIFLAVITAAVLMGFEIHEYGMLDQFIK